MTMGSSDTLGSVEFLEVVGGDLGVAPDENFEVKDEDSKILDESGESSSNWSTNSLTHSKMSQKTLKNSTNAGKRTATTWASQ